MARNREGRNTSTDTVDSDVTNTTGGGNKPDTATGGGNKPDTATGGGNKPDTATGGGNKPDTVQELPLIYILGDPKTEVSKNIQRSILNSIQFKIKEY